MLTTKDTALVLIDVQEKLLRAMHDKEVLVEIQSRSLFQYWNAYLFGSPRVDCGFVDDDITSRKNSSDSSAGGSHCTKVRPFVFINRCGNGHDVDVAFRQF